jgi:hypothetical protein
VPPSEPPVLPATSTFQGPGNPRVKQPCRKGTRGCRCPKGTHKVRRGGKVRCVKPKPKKHRQSRR